jgi:hypothetical protein
VRAIWKTSSCLVGTFHGTGPVPKALLVWAEFKPLLLNWILYPVVGKRSLLILKPVSIQQFKFVEAVFICLTRELSNRVVSINSVEYYISAFAYECQQGTEIWIWKLWIYVTERNRDICLFLIKCTRVKAFPQNCIIASLDPSTGSRIKLFKALEIIGLVDFVHQPEI